MSKKEDRQQELLGYWQEAKGQEYGLRVETPDRKLLSQQLYRARTLYGQPDFDHLAIIMPEGKEELWIVKRDADE